MGRLAVRCLCTCTHHSLQQTQAWPWGDSAIQEEKGGQDGTSLGPLLTSQEAAPPL